MNKIEIKKFLGIVDVRIVNSEWIVLKDMFQALGRVKEDGTWTDEKNKAIEFLKGIEKESDLESFVVTSKTSKKKSRETQEVECLKLATAPIILTQFKPTARKGEEALKSWFEFMKFVDRILAQLEVYQYIITDKKKQLDHAEMIHEMGGKPMLQNMAVNRIMGKLIGVDFPIKKDELKEYQIQTTIDLLEVRDFVMTKFENAYEITESHSEAEKVALRLALKKYPFKEVI